MKWETKDGRKLEITEMETDHIKNCIKMLERRGFISTETLSIYLTAPCESMGEMAFDFFIINDICTRPVSKYLDAFKKELERRKKNDCL